MAPIDDVLRRLGEDPGFRAALDLDPAAALREYPLGPDDLARVEDAVRAGTTSAPAPGPPASAAATGGRGWLLGTGLAGVAGLAIGAVLGVTGAVADPRPTVLAPRQSVVATTCATAGDPGAPAATLGTGDRVYVVGRDEGSDRLAVRDPGDLAGLPVWVPAAVLTPDGGIDGLPVIPCGEPAGPIEPTDEAATGATTTAVAGETTTTSSSTTSTTVTGETTTTTTGAAPAPTTIPASPPTAPTPTAPPPTAPPDTTGPTVSVTPDRASMHTDGSPEQLCRDTTVDLTASATDPGGATITAVTWRFQAPGRPAQSGAASALGGNRFRIGPFFGPNVPVSGSTQVTISATARDGAGNTTERSAVVTLTAFGDDCIG